MGSSGEVSKAGTGGEVADFEFGGVAGPGGNDSHGGSGGYGTGLATGCPSSPSRFSTNHRKHFFGLNFGSCQGNLAIHQFPSRDGCVVREGGGQTAKQKD